jgi:transcriptional regulator with XRE-family HTH domain
MKEVIKLTFADRLKQLRREFNMTQDELAKKINKNRSTVAGYETEGKEPDYDTLLKLSQIFNVSTDYLLGQTDIRNQADEITDAVSDDPELAEFWEQMKNRETLKILFKQTKNLDDKDIKQIIRIIKAIEDEEDREN